jgi:hypothetical protein
MPYSRVSDSGNLEDQTDILFDVILGVVVDRASPGLDGVTYLVILLSTRLTQTFLCLVRR